MYALINGKIALLRLNSIWGEITSASVPTREIIYRIEKLSLRLDAVADKIFIKTVKAREILFECIQLTEQFQSKLNKQCDEAFTLLTRIESHIDDLVKKTHDFRIKAG